MLLYEDHTAVVHAVAFSPDGAALASGARDGSLVLREADGRAVPVLERGPKTPPVYAVDFFPDGALVIGHPAGWLVFRRGPTGAWRLDEPPAATPATALAVLDGGTVAVGTGDRLKPTPGKFELWDVPGRRRIEPTVTEMNGVRAVAACPAKGLVAWATGHRRAKVWDVRRPDVREYPLRENSPALALSPDGTTLAVAFGWAVGLYDVERRRERAVLKAHKGKVEAVAFAPDGATLATGSWDQTVRLWDPATGRERAAFRWPVNRVTALAYAPDGLRLAAGGDLGGVVVWDVE